MYKLLFTLLAVLLLAGMVSAQHPHGSSSTGSYRTITEYRFTTEIGQWDRFMEDDNRGTFNEYSGNLSINSGPYTLISYRYTGYDYGSVDLSGLEGNRSTASYGGTIPVSRRFKIRAVHNAWVENETDETVQALGGYLDYQVTSRWRFEFGTELFAHQAPETYYLLGERNFGYGPITPMTPPVNYLYTGFSKHYVQQEGEEHQFDDRLMVAGSITFGWIRIGAGFAQRTDSLHWSSDTHAWSLALGIPSSDQEGSFSPTLYAKFSYKPRSRHLHLMGSLWGTEMPDFVMNMMFRSNFRSLLSPTRVVNNQSFNIRAQNIHTSEQGRVGWYAVYFEFDPTDYLTSKNFKGAAYYTHTPWKLEPYTGYIYSYQEDVTYNFMERKLESPGHAQHLFEAGLQISNVNLSGTIAIGSDGFEGGSISTTTWF